MGVVIVLGLSTFFRRPATAPAANSGLLAGARKARRDHPAVVRAWMPAVLSVLFVGAALYVILSKDYGAATEKWAFGTSGSVLGYWLGQAAKS